MMKIRVLTGFVFLLASFAGSCAVASPRGIAATDSVWVDSVFHTLTPDQRIAQLMIIRAFSDRDSVYNDSLTGLIKRFDPGGVCFFKGTPFRQANLTNLWQHTAQTPLLIATDAENGLGMRLDSAVAFPRQMTLGAMTEDSLVARVATVIARDCRRMGIQMNFAPVADINNNPDNPVIGARSFGEDRELVARRSVIIMKGLQKGGIISTAKHFPGHGDTDSDSHLTLPVIRHPENRLDSLELYPFKELIRNGVEGIMVAHLFVPALDSANNEPATLSQKIVTGFLRERLGFRGFIITDALDMKGVTKYYKPGEIEVKALLAGNDILLLPQNIEKAVNAIRLAGDSSQVIRDLVDRKCRNILNIKYRAGLDHPEPVLLDHLYEDLNPLSSTLLTRDIFRASITW